MSDVPARIEAVDRTALRHAYGTAEDVPAMLRNLRRPEKAADAADDLLTHVHHQGGGVHSSAPAALPHVVAAAVDPAVAADVRDELLHLVRSPAYPAVTETVKLLAEIGTDAAPAQPALRAFLDADERPVRHNTWRSVPEDDALCDAVRAALLAISAPDDAV